MPKKPKLPKDVAEDFNRKQGLKLLQHRQEKAFQETKELKDNLAAAFYDAIVFCLAVDREPDDRDLQTAGESALVISTLLVSMGALDPVLLTCLKKMTLPPEIH